MMIRVCHVMIRVRHVLISVSCDIRVRHVMIIVWRVMLGECYDSTTLSCDLHNVSCDLIAHCRYIERFRRAPPTRRDERRDPQWGAIFQPPQHPPSSSPSSSSSSLSSVSEGGREGGREERGGDTEGRLLYSMSR